MNSTDSGPSPARAKFKLGRIVITPNAQDQLREYDIQGAIQRHQSGDWGVVNEHDRNANEQALVENSRLVSAYLSTDGARFLLITEADRSFTTILMPEDY